MARAYYIDRIRVILTALVILHHTAITYGAPGGWYYRELPTPTSLTGLLFILFVSVNQAYFMGFFFLIAGYFTPASYDRKGPGRFFVDRLIRLGIPLAAFAIILDPLTNAISLAWGRPPEKAVPFLPDFLHRIFTADWNNGPLWFAQALLIFSAAYIGWRTLRGTKAGRMESPVPSFSAWLLSALGVGAGALLIRQWVPVGENVLQLQLGYFSSYIFLFALGAVAWRHNWFDRLTWKMARGWVILSIVLLPAIIVTAILSGRMAGKSVNFSGGFSFPAILYAFWEPFIAWGIIAAYLIWFREHGNHPSAIWEYLAARAYAAYILHPPVLVAIGVALRPWEAPALAKFAVTGTLALLATLGFSSLLLRVPGARRVV
jgi:peptidoglycan/LPS O-acetylase OafA/YrhL